MAARGICRRLVKRAQLFEVDYDEAKAIAQQLAQFREVPAAMSTEVQRSQAIKQRWARIRTDNRPLVSPVEPADYIKEMNSPEFLTVSYQLGKNVQQNGIPNDPAGHR